LLNAKQFITIISITFKLIASLGCYNGLTDLPNTQFESCILIAILGYFLHLIFDDIIYLFDEEDEEDPDHGFESSKGRD